MKFRRPTIHILPSISMQLYAIICNCP